MHVFYLYVSGHWYLVLLKDELLVRIRLQKSFSSVGYFVLKYGDILSGINIIQLNEQFLNYQLLAETDIPK